MKLSQRVFISLAMLLPACSIQKKYNKPVTGNDIYSICLASEIPFGVKDGTLFTKRDSCALFFYQGLALYRLPCYYSSVEMKMNETGDTLVPAKVLDEGVKYMYYGYQPGNPHGVFFGQPGKDTVIHVNMDSVFNRNSLFFFLVSRAYALNKTEHNDELVNTRTLPGGNRVETYFSTIKKNISYYDSSYIYFTPADRMQGITFSLCPELDSLRQMKLYRFRVVFNADPGSPDPFLQHAREIIVEYNRLPVTEPDTLKKWFNKTKALL